MNHIHYISRHAGQERLQQRGIPDEMLLLIDRYGDRSRIKSRKNHSYDSANYLYFSHRSIKKMKDQGIDMQLVQLAEKKSHLRFVVSDDGGLITALYACKNNRRVQN